MTLFEYITVAVSIVLSLCIVRSVDAVGSVWRSERRYSVHLAWTSIKSFQPLLMWWSLWGLHDAESWNFLAFVLCVAGPALLYLQIATLVTREPEEVDDWRAHFFSVRRRFFGTGILMAITGPLLLVVLGSLRAASGLAIGGGLEVALAVVGIRSASPRVHAFIVSVEGAAFAAWALILFWPVGR